MSCLAAELRDALLVPILPPQNVIGALNLNRQMNLAQYIRKSHISQQLNPISKCPCHSMPAMAPLILLHARFCWLSFTLEILLQHIISLQAAEYFSIVRRRACWASFVSLSTSSSTSTCELHPQQSYWETCFSCLDLWYHISVPAGFDITVSKLEDKTLCTSVS